MQSGQQAERSLTYDREHDAHDVCVVRVSSARYQVLLLGVLHTYADDILRADQDAVGELQLWTRHGENYDDGVPAHGVNAHSDERACSFSLRDFDLGSHQPVSTPEPPEAYGR